MDALAEIEALVAYEGRWAGSVGEHRAAEHLAARLRSLGRDAEVEPATIHPDYALTYVLHALLALVGSAISERRPRLGAGALVVAAVSALGDLSTRFHVLRRLTRTAVTHNVLSRERSGKPGTLVLLAHYDAARTGWIFDSKSLERQARLGRRFGRQIGPFEPVVWSLLALPALAVLRAAGIESPVLKRARIPPLLTLTAVVPLLLQVRAAQVVPGAADNASGVATVLRLAERYGGRLRHHDVWVLLTGAEEALLLGMREWLRRHQHELDPRRTIFLNIDEAGHGTVRYATREGLDFARPYDQELIELCDHVRAADHDGRFGAQSMVSRFATDACVAALHGYKAIRISCLPELNIAPDWHQPTDTPERLQPEALERVFEFCSQLIERIDDRVAR
jgi:hypothetical protein